MNITRALVSSSVMAVCLLGCNTAPPESPTFIAHASAPLLPELEADTAGHFQPCYVGLGVKSCMDLDPRPFKACLLGGDGDRCPRDAQVEPLGMQGETPARVIVVPGNVERR